MSDAGQARPHRRPLSGRRRRWALRTVRRAAIAGVAVSVVVAAVPPLRQAALYGATATVLRGADRWAPSVGPFAAFRSEEVAVLNRMLQAVVTSGTGRGSGIEVVPRGHLRRRHAAGPGGRGPPTHRDGRTRRAQPAPAPEFDRTVPPAGIRTAATRRTARPHGRCRR